MKTGARILAEREGFDFPAAHFSINTGKTDPFPTANPGG
jgi:hypothetical protein